MKRFGHRGNPEKAEKQTRRRKRNQRVSQETDGAIRHHRMGMRRGETRLRKNGRISTSMCRCGRFLNHLFEKQIHIHTKGGTKMKKVLPAA